MEIHLDAQSDVHLLVLVLKQRPFILKFLPFFFPSCTLRAKFSLLVLCLLEHQLYAPMGLSITLEVHVHVVALPISGADCARVESAGHMKCSHLFNKCLVCTFFISPKAGAPGCTAVSLGAVNAVLTWRIGEMGLGIPSSARAVICMRVKARANRHEASLVGVLCIVTALHSRDIARVLRGHCWPWGKGNRPSEKREAGTALGLVGDARGSHAKLERAAPIILAVRSQLHNRPLSDGVRIVPIAG